jgi:hypothetical protein
MLEAELSGADFLAGKWMTWWLSDRADGHRQSLSLAAQPPSFFGYMALTIVPWAPSKRVEEGGLVRFFFLLGCEAPGTLDWWVVFCTGCDSELSGWYPMFCAGQYVVESWVNCLGRGDMQVRSDFGLRAERKPGCQSSFSRLRGRIQAHCAVLGTPPLPIKWCMHSSLCSCPVWCKAPYGHTLNSPPLQ